MSIYFSNRYFPIPFEHGKIFKLVLVSIVMYGLSIVIGKEHTILEVSFKIVLLFIFPFVLFIFKFYEEIELVRLFSFFKKILRIEKAE